MCAECYGGSFKDTLDLVTFIRRRVSEDATEKFNASDRGKQLLADIVSHSINSDYSEDEYFRELSKCCKENKFNLLYTKGIDKNENDSSYHKIPTIFERFSDIITVLK